MPEKPWSRTPEILEPTEYDDIARCMLEDKPDLPSGLIRIKQHTLDSPSLTPMRNDCSFARQLREVAANPRYAPDAYLFTANSAIPVADSVRGYFDTINTATPPFSHILSNSRVSFDYFYAQGQCEKAQDNIKTEAERLSVVLSGLKHICIVDQYVATGNTIKYAHIILSRAGVKKVTAIRGQWHEDVDKKPVNLNELTSQHRNIMHDIGEKAALAVNRQTAKLTSPYRYLILVLEILLNILRTRE